jgi:PKD repeat protein
MVGDSFNTVHYWNFGDGGTVSAVAPSHTYATVGSFSVKHYIVKHNPNGVVLCSDTVTKVVLIQQTSATCNADFTTQFLTGNAVKFIPSDSTMPLSTLDNWSFGDGTYSTFINSPTHTYAAPGTYTIGHGISKWQNGVVICTDTTTKQITVTGTAGCTLQAYFTYNADSLNWNTIHFQNQSQPNAPGDSIRWNFGDGSAPINGLVGTLSTPSHVYANAGVYNVCIRVKKNNTAGGTPCVSEICKTVIVAPPCNLVANFNWTSTTSSPLVLAFHNLSVPLATGDSVRWTFGDGTVSFDVNPTHTYTTSGTYTVCLRVKKNYNIPGIPPCVSEICKTVVVTGACNLVANFSAQADNTHPLRIKFTNLSVVASPTDSVRWTFGDGSSVSGLQSDPNVANPTHDYAQGSAYSVCLRVKRNNNTPGTTPCVGEICKLVTVIPPCNTPVSFTMHRDSVNIRKVYFNNTTAAPTATATAKWSFGDGTFATTWNAVHEYAQPGLYRVCLTVQFAPNCIKETCDTVVIPNPPPSCQDISKFKFEKSSTDAQKYTFTPDYIANDIVYTWTFGDGTGSHDPIAIHRYAQPGVYIACLTAWRGPNCASTTCKEIKVLPQINCDSIHVSYSYQRDPFVPNKVYFYANANFPILDQTWTISKLNPATTPPVILHQNNPIYVFNDTGYYRVCLRAITLGGCVKEFCSVIHIEHVATNLCELQAFPNPTTNQVNVNVTLTAPGMIDGYIYNTMNTLVKEKHQQGIIGNNVVTFNINDLIPGLYTIKMVYGGKTCYARFTKL